MSEPASSPGPGGILDGVRVLDLTRFLAGPQATLLLAGLGAEVIRVDDPATGDPTADAPPYLGPDGVSFERRTPGDLGIAYLKRARGKKAITLNLKHPDGREIFLDLVDRADALVENFRVGVTERLGIDYPTLARRNPRLVHCAITGYGTTGPDRDLKAYDLTVQAAVGLMSITGDPPAPPTKAGSPLADGVAGVFAVVGILGALWQRARTGKGQFIDVAMADALLALIFDEPLDCYERLGVPFRQGNRIMRLSPFNAFPTVDGAVVLGAGTDADWVRLLGVMGRRDLTQSPDFMSAPWRVAHNAKVDEVVAAWTRHLTTHDVIARLNAADVPCGPIRDFEAVLRWPHLAVRGMLPALEHPAYGPLHGVAAPGFPLKFSGASTGYDRPAPFVGEHTRQVLGGLLNLSDTELARLHEAGVI